MNLTEFSPFKEYKNASYENTYQIYEKGLCLPSSTVNSEGEIYYVYKILKGFI